MAIFFAIVDHEGRMQTVAALELTNEDRKRGVMTFKVVGDGTGALPKQITLAKNLPQFKSDFKELSDYCAESPMRFWKDYYQKQGKKFP